jgi:hypothetical protein
VLAGVAAEVIEGMLVRLKELRQPLVQRGVIETPPAEPQGQHEEVHRRRLMPEVHPCLPPVDLALLTRRRLEAHRRALVQRLDRPQRLHEALHCLVAAGVVLLPQLLEQHLGRVADPRRSFPQINCMTAQQRVGPRRALVAAPRLLLQATADGLAVDIQSPSDLSDRQALFVAQPANLLPAVFLDHGLLLEGQSLVLHGPTVTNRIPLHRAPPLSGWGLFNDHSWRVLHDR